MSILKLSSPSMPRSSKWFLSFSSHKTKANYYFMQITAILNLSQSYKLCCECTLLKVNFVTSLFRLTHEQVCIWANLLCCLPEQRLNSHHRKTYSFIFKPTQLQTVDSKCEYLDVCFTQPWKEKIIIDRIWRPMSVSVVSRNEAPWMF
jgi:hypothetical protein